MGLLVLDVSRLAREITRPPDNREESRSYQRLLADMFKEAGDPIEPVAVERWRQRGGIPTTRLLMLLQMAKNLGMSIDLLDYCLPAKRLERAEGARPTKGRSSLQFNNWAPADIGRPPLKRIQGKPHDDGKT